MVASCSEEPTRPQLPPACSLEPALLNFGDVPVSSSSPLLTFTIRNTGGGVLAGTARISDFGAGDFWFLTVDPHSSVEVDYQLGAGQSQVFYVEFLPRSIGVHTTTIDPGSSGCVSVTCQGNGI
jgi:hypothetical protein